MSSLRFQLGNVFRRLQVITGLMRLSERRPAPAIIVYHGVCRDSAGDDGIFITSDVFRAHLRFLRRSRKIVPVAAIVDSMSRGVGCDARWIAITFDDAFSETVDIVAQEMGELPWTLNVPVGLVNSDRSLWPQELRLIGRRYPRETRDCVKDAGLPVQQRECAGTIQETIRYLLGAGDIVRASLFARLISTLGEERFVAAVSEEPRYRISNLKQLTSLQAMGVSIGVHGHQHEALGESASAECVHREIAMAKIEIESMLRSTISTFAFPFGIESAAARDAVQNAGFTSALTSRFSPVRCQPTSGTFWLPRIAGEWPLDLFRAVLAKQK